MHTTRCTLHTAQGMTSTQVQDRAAAAGVNVRVINSSYVGVSFGEAVVEQDVTALLQVRGCEELCC